MEEEESNNSQNFATRPKAPSWSSKFFAHEHCYAVQHCGSSNILSLESFLSNELIRMRDDSHKEESCDVFKCPAEFHRR